VSKIDGLEWASLGSYLNWLDAYLELQPINVSKIWSVRVNGNFSRTVRDKKNTLNRIEENLSSVQGFIARARPDVDPNGELIPTEAEMMVLNTLVGNYEYYAQILRDQINSLAALEEWEQLRTEYVGLDDVADSGRQDDLPF
jgi:hypothetical protein